MNRLADKVAIVTGAASGQGAAEARLFAAEGARVVLTDMNETAGKKVAETNRRECDLCTTRCLAGGRLEERRREREERLQASRYSCQQRGCVSTQPPSRTAMRSCSTSTIGQRRGVGSQAVRYRRWPTARVKTIVKSPPGGAPRRYPEAFAAHGSPGRRWSDTHPRC